MYTPGLLRAVLDGNGARTGEPELMIRLHPNAGDRPGAASPHGAAEPTDGELLGRFAKVRDRAALELLDNGEPGPYNVVDNEPVTQIEFFRWLASILQKPMPPSAPADSNRKRGVTNDEGMFV